MKGWARLTGGTPQLTPDLVEIYRHDWAYGSARAEARARLPLPAAAEGSTDAAWLRETGHGAVRAAAQRSPSRAGELATRVGELARKVVHMGGGR